MRVAEQLDPARLLTPPGFDGNADPHVWMDVSLWTAALNVVRDRLIEFDPAGADRYRANAADYAGKLARLDTYARETLASIPEQSRVLVTAHDAFNYLGRAYGLEVRGIQGISTESEAGLREIEGAGRSAGNPQNRRRLHRDERVGAQYPGTDRRRRRARPSGEDRRFAVFRCDGRSWNL